MYVLFESEWVICSIRQWSDGERIYQGSAIAQARMARIKRLLDEKLHVMNFLTPL